MTDGLKGNALYYGDNLDVLDREKAPIGVFLTLEPPTQSMEKEAASAGFYILGERQYSRLQIITVEQALAAAKPA